MSPLDKNKTIRTAKDSALLAERLSRCPYVVRQDVGEEKDAWALTHCFADLEGSFRTFLDELLPKLVNEDLQPEAVCDLLREIGDESRHILYHIREPKFYKYLE